MGPNAPTVGIRGAARGQFQPRGKTNICDSCADPQYARMPDAYAAKAYLASQSFVDGNRVGLMGWSHGGRTTLYAVDNIYLDRINPAPFKAAIAWYPGCLLRLLGECSTADSDRRGG